MLYNFDPPPPAPPQPGDGDGAGPSQPAAPVAAAKHLSMREKQETLRKLLTTGWLASVPSKPGYYTLGPRTFLELGDYLLGLPDLPQATKREWNQLL